MIIQMDTREQQDKKKHILSYFEQEKIKIIRSKCYVGDWTRLDKQDVCIDTKTGGLQEVYQNVVSSHARFRSECIRARESGIRLIILIEEEKISSLEDVPLWENPRRKRWLEIDHQHRLGKKLYIKQPKEPPISSEKLHTIMRTMQDKYGVEWQFCKPEDCGKRIVEILGGENEQTKN